MAFVYRNPNADAYATSGFQFFRLKQALVSAGDIFESPQGAHAFALGPDSDISLATIAYLDQQSVFPYSSQDPQTQTNVSTLTVSPQRPFATFLPAANGDANYVPSRVPGRLLIWPTEIYDATWLPPGFNVNQDKIIFEPPIIDILQFFSPPSNIVPARTDKTYYYDKVPFGIDDVFIMIPFYGRRYASISLKNGSTDQNCTVTVSGVNFRISETLAGPIPLISAYTLGFAETNSRVVYDNYDNRIGETPPLTNVNAGLFDYLLIQLDPIGGGASPVTISCRVVVSDQTP